MNWYWYVIITLSLYIVSIFIKVVFLSKQFVKTKEDYKTVEELLSYTIGALRVIMIPLWFVVIIFEKLSSKIRFYKHYFDRSDTPFIQDFQKGKKYQCVWKLGKYEVFLNHKVVKIKLFGLFTIYTRKPETAL